MSGEGVVEIRLLGCGTETDGDLHAGTRYSWTLSAHSPLSCGGCRICSRWRYDMAHVKLDGYESVDCITYDSLMLLLSVKVGQLLNEAYTELGIRNGSPIPQSVSFMERHRRNLCVGAASVMRLAADLLSGMPQSDVDDAMHLVFNRCGDSDGRLFYE